MDIKFSCDQCAQHIAVEEEWQGQIVVCPHCGNNLTVPEISTVTTGEIRAHKDITFDCVKCGHQIVIDEAGVGMKVSCPACAAELIVPPLSQPKLVSHSRSSAEQPTHPIPSPVPSVVGRQTSHRHARMAPLPLPSTSATTKRSGWSIALRVIGILSLVAGFVGFCVALSGAHPESSSLVLSGAIVASGVLVLFISFLIDVLTDIRSFLKQLVERQ